MTAGPPRREGDDGKAATVPSVVSLRLAVALVARPDLWTTALRTGWQLATPGWWRRWPFAPRPPRFYEAFRHQTMFGGEPGARLTFGQLTAYLEWCRAMRRLR